MNEVTRSDANKYNRNKHEMEVKEEEDGGKRINFIQTTKNKMTIAWLLGFKRGKKVQMEIQR